LARTPLGQTVGFIPDSLSASVLRALLGDYGPALAAVLAVAIVEGHNGLRAFFAGLLRWQCSARLYVLALALPLALVGVAMIVGITTGTVAPATDPVNPLRVFAIFFLMIVLDGPLGEEVGWRGLLLPRLLEFMNPVPASLLVGMVWWAWHIPIYLADGKANSAFDWAMFLVTTLSLSLVVGRFYLRTGGSVLIAILFHTASNYAIFLFLRTLWRPLGEATELRLTYAGLLVIAAALAAWSMSSRRSGCANEWV
jgi:membrane protease YdiL (CAAX protease family)